MLWVKAFHIIFVTSWFAGLFYLPRLFVNHAMVNDAAFLHTLVMPATNDFAIANEDGPDGDAAFRKTLLGFVDGGLEEWVHVV